MFGTSSFTIWRDVHSDDPDQLDEVVGEIEIEVEVSYTMPEEQSWDSPGDPGNVSIGDAFDGRTKVELTDDEKRYIEENFFESLANEQADYEYHQDEMDLRHPF
jgi:hypothetical protein